MVEGRFAGGGNWVPGTSRDTGGGFECGKIVQHIFAYVIDSLAGQCGTVAGILPIVCIYVVHNSKCASSLITPPIQNLQHPLLCCCPTDRTRVCCAVATRLSPTLVTRSREWLYSFRVRLTRDVNVSD
jgi:hypothetical protein